MKHTAKAINKELEKIPYMERTKAKRLLPHLKPHAQPSYFFYRKHRKTDHEVGENRTKFSNAVGEIFKAISEVMFEHEGGVFLERYGYFTPMVIKYMEKYDNIEKYPHTDMNTYALYLFTDTTNKSCIKGMCMDRTFDYRAKNRFKEVIYTSYRPKLYYTLLTSLFGHKNKRKY